MNPAAEQGIRSYGFENLHSSLRRTQIGVNGRLLRAIGLNVMTDAVEISPHMRNQVNLVDD
jgi:hypothetical protein